MAAMSEPLEARLWFGRVKKIADGEIPEIERALRHAFHLLQLIPNEFRHIVRLQIEEDELEALLDAGDFDGAARQLLANPTALGVRENEPERTSAVISCPILKRTMEGEGDSIASAILGAWTNAFLAIEKEVAPSLLNPTDQPQPGCQSERDQRLKPH